MVVQHNLRAMNSQRMLGITQGTLGKTTEKLSSGYRINRAADDAAGLSISEKMRKQIRGLTQASTNAEDGISAVQTAEGALGEVHDMLQRMNELAVQAANGTNSATDRDYIQSEIDQLSTEIDRVATTTKFNETYLLKGTNKNNGNNGALSYATAETAIKTNMNISNFDKVTGVGSIDINEAAGTVALTGDLATTTNYKAYEIKIGPAGSQTTYSLVISTSAKGTATAGTVAEVVDNLNTGKKHDKRVAFSSMDDLIGQLKKDFNKTGDIKSITSLIDSQGQEYLEIQGFADLNANATVDLHVGADSSDDNKIDMSIANMSSRGLGVNGLKVYGDDTDNATAAIDVIQAAIQKVSTQRSSLGAIQNRLEHTIKNLDNVVENTTAAESQIRDTDMATEMVKYSNNNILAQAGQAMLAQANQSNQGVLSLLG